MGNTIKVPKIRVTLIKTEYIITICFVKTVKMFKHQTMLCTKQILSEKIF